MLSSSSESTNIIIFERERGNFRHTVSSLKQALILKLCIQFCNTNGFDLTTRWNKTVLYNTKKYINIFRAVQPHIKKKISHLHIHIKYTSMFQCNPVISQRLSIKIMRIRHWSKKCYLGMEKKEKRVIHIYIHL